LTKRDERALLQDILDCAQEAIDFCQGQTLATFTSDRMRQLAVVRLIQLIGEASIRLNDETRQKFPSVPWHQLRAMRNILVHQYEGIEDAIVWNPNLIEEPGVIEALSLVERQKYLKKSGRYIDLLFKNKKKYLIVEIKCIFINQISIITDQVLEYKKGLAEEFGISEDEIICSLVTSKGFSEEVTSFCKDKGVIAKKLDENDTDLVEYLIEFTSKRELDQRLTGSPFPEEIRHPRRDHCSDQYRKQP